MKMWTYAWEPIDVVEVDCPDGLYPAKDSRGEPIYENTHFPTRYEALCALRREVSAGVSLGGRRVEEAEKTLIKAQLLAGNAAVVFKELQDKFGACWAFCMVEGCERECCRYHSTPGHRPFEHWCEDHMGGDPQGGKK